MTTPAAHELAERLGRLDALDPVARTIGRRVRAILKPGPVKDALSGTWLGHPLHPLLTDVPIGTWTSATLLDLLGGRDAEGAAELLIGAGLTVTLPTLWSGWSDWSDSEQADPAVRRLGVLHATANGTAAALYAASLVARRRGAHGRGKALGLAGATALGAGGFLGGHLAYAKGVGADVTAFEDRSRDWTAVDGAAGLAEGAMLRARVGEADVLVARSGGRLHALAARCTHRGGPLDEGTLTGGCVECPWHGSRFALADGSVERGPATAPQPVYEVRERDGRVEVRDAG